MFKKKKRISDSAKVANFDKKKHICAEKPHVAKCIFSKKIQKIVETFHQKCHWCWLYVNIAWVSLKGFSEAA